VGPDRLATSAGPSLRLAFSIMAMKDNLLVLGDSSQAYLVAADAKECRVVSSATVCGKNWCSPAYVDGKLLTRDHGALRCLELLK